MAIHLEIANPIIDTKPFKYFKVIIFQLSVN